MHSCLAIDKCEVEINFEPLTYFEVFATED